jgi:hypothetical protein
MLCSWALSPSAALVRAAGALMFGRESDKQKARLQGSSRALRGAQADQGGRHLKGGAHRGTPSKGDATPQPANRKGPAL